MQTLVDQAQEALGRFVYMGPFVLLLISGMGFPLPEEVTLIGSGMLVSQGDVNFWAICIVCALAILIGDSVPYWLGRRYGAAALEVRWIARVLHPERMLRIRRRFEEHGDWVVFTCRFLTGIRIPGYFTAGMLRMGYPRFLLLDFLGVLIMVPLFVWLGNLFGESVESLYRRVENLHLLLAFGLISVLVIVLVRTHVRRQADRSRTRTAAVTLTTSEVEPPPPGAE